MSGFSRVRGGYSIARFGVFFVFVILRRGGCGGGLAVRG